MCHIYDAKIKGGYVTMTGLTQAQVKANMKEILHVRYTNVELEKSLCLEMLQWGEVHDDFHVQAFAHTYLGDYYIRVNDSEQSISHLMDARDISVKYDDNELLVRIYSLLGYYYHSIADDQSALEYYIEGITICHVIEDEAFEALILNNIGYSLQRYHGYEQAYKFYKQAYDQVRYSDDRLAILGIILNNLTTVSILLQQIEEAQ